jgi:hypothetical protein
LLFFCSKKLITHNKQQHSPTVLELETVTAPKLGGLLLPKNTLLLGASAHLVEIDLSALVPPAVLNEFSTELWRRAEKRVTAARTTAQQIEAERHRAETMAEERRVAKEEEERRIRAFFNLAEQQQRDSLTTPPPRRAESPPGSFAAVVSLGGYFPALPPSAHVQQAGSETFTLQKMSSQTPQPQQPSPLGVWGKSVIRPASSSPIDPPQLAGGPSFASVLKNTKKQPQQPLYANNPSRRGSG